MHLSKEKISAGKIDYLIEAREATFIYDPEKGLRIEVYSGKRTYLYSVWLSPYEVRRLKEKLNAPPPWLD